MTIGVETQCHHCKGWLTEADEEEAQECEGLLFCAECYQKLCEKCDPVELFPLITGDGYE